MVKNKPHHILEGPTMRKPLVAFFGIFPLAFSGSTQHSRNGNINNQLTRDIALKGIKVQLS